MCFIYLFLKHGLTSVFQESRSAKFIHTFLVKKSLTTHKAAYELAGVALLTKIASLPPKEKNMTRRTPHVPKPKHCEARNQQKIESYTNKDFPEVPQPREFYKDTKS